MRTSKQKQGRLRLLVAGGLVALVAAVAVMVVMWTTDSADASKGAQSSHGRLETPVSADGPTHQPAGDAGEESAPAETAPPAAAPAKAAKVEAVPTTLGSATGAPADVVKVKAYFIQGEKLVPVTKQIASTPLVGTAAVKLLLAGPSAADKSAGLTSEIPGTANLRSLLVRNGLATVDLGAGFTSGGGTMSQYLRLGQLVFTLTEFPTIDRVEILIDGNKLRALGGEGLLIGSSIDRAGWQKLIGVSSGGAGEAAPKVSSFKVYFVTGEKLTAHSRMVPFTPTVGNAAVQNLLVGPGSAEKDRGAGTCIPAGVKVYSLTVKDRVATIDLSKEFVSGGGSQSMHLRLGQLVYTLTEFPTVDRVRLKVEGKTVTSLGGEGLLIGQPLSRADWAKLLK